MHLFFAVKAKIAKKICVSGLEIEKGVLLLDKFLYNSTSFFRKRQNIGMILAFFIHAKTYFMT
ncbi:hypothetical protein BCV50_14630 [Bacillus subtilis]|nr:hypothetical protein BCV50_14630 [Bacillus subtilis]